MFSLSEDAKKAIEQVQLEPNIVLEIEGVSTIFSAIQTEAPIAIGSPDLIIGTPPTEGTFYIGQLGVIRDQIRCLSFENSSRTIRQTLEIDKGKGSSISTLDIALLDFNGEITRLVTPGEVVDDILGRRCRIYTSFKGLAFPEDFITVFRGEITEIRSEPGKVLFQINHPENKKRFEVFKAVSHELDGAINNVTTTVVLDSVSDLLYPIVGPSGGIDPAFKSYIRVDDELIEYTGVSGNQLTGVVRGALGTTAASHSDEAAVSSFYVLEENAMILALKLMLSGWAGPFQEDVEVESFNWVSPLANIPNAIFFSGIDVETKYGIVVGDYVTTTGATNGANNVSLEVISDIVLTEDGSYIVIDGVSFVDETNSPAQIAFRSQYDTLPDGWKMYGDEVDIAEHLRLYQLFLSSFSYRFYVRDEGIDRDYLEEQIYSPIACYSLPRKAQASVGYHIGPVPGQDIQLLDDSNVKSPTQTKLVRSKAKYFYNEILYKFDEQVIEPDKYDSGQISISTLSKARIGGAAKQLKIESKGLRRDLQGAAIASSQASRRLDRYRYASEMISLQLKYGPAYRLEIGDIVLFDGSAFNLVDIKTGERGPASRLYEIVQKTVDLSTGQVNIDLLDTNFDGAGRYGLISPSSRILTGISTTKFTIQESFCGKEGTAEYRKWQQLLFSGVKVRSSDFSVSFDTVIQNISLNTITVSPALPWIPPAGYVMEFSDYVVLEVTDNQKLIYVWQVPAGGFADASADYIML